MGEAVRHALADVLARGEFGDPVLERHIVSIPEVRVSPDLAHATVYVMPVGATPDERDEVLGALKRHSGRLRSAVAARVQLRRTPELRYVVDESFDEASRMARVLADVAARAGGPAGPGGKTEPDQADAAEGAEGASLPPGEPAGSGPPRSDRG